MRAIWKGAVSFGLVSIGGEAVLGDRGEGHPVPPGAPHRRRPDQVQADLLGRRRGGQLRRHRQGLRPRRRRDGHPHRRRLRRPAADQQPRDRRAAVRAGRAGRPDPLQQGVLPRAGRRRPPSRTCCCATRCVDSDRVAIVKVALRQREQLATLRVRDGVLVLNTMLWPDEVRAADVRLPRRGHDASGRRSWPWPRR